MNILPGKQWVRQSWAIIVLVFITVWFPIEVMAGENAEEEPGRDNNYQVAPANPGILPMEFFTMGDPGDGLDSDPGDGVLGDPGDGDDKIRRKPSVSLFVFPVIFLGSL